MVTETSVLAAVMDKTRQLTQSYLQLLKDVDLHKVFKSDGIPLNNVFWLNAHLAVTENFLLLKCTGGDSVKIPWAKQFGLGSTVLPKEECPPLDEVKEIFDLVHSKSISHVSQLGDDFLPQVNPTGFSFAGENTIRSMIVHAIRHEGGHAGHLSWLCKLHGIKTI